jgi:dephospho-CoA kinase
MNRVLAQASDADRAAVCDIDLDGAGTVEQLRAQVDEFWSTHLP